MRVLISPNAFKHSVTAGEAAEAIRRGLDKSNLGCTCMLAPVGDGGDGTAELLIQALGGERIETVVRDPLGRLISTHYGRVSDTAIIEMANASGLRLLSSAELNPLEASSYGTGELISHALNQGARKVLLGIGGSATVDGGAGALQALGARFIGEGGIEIIPVPSQISRAASIDLSGVLPDVSDYEIIILCDVENPLTGPEGAAAVFGPQKGATGEDVKKLELALEHFAKLIQHRSNVNVMSMTHGGAAGGIAAGLAAAANARLVNGIDYFLEVTGFSKHLAQCDLVITGEGSIDEQTLQGKAPYGVAREARKQDKPVIALAGRIELDKTSRLLEYFHVLLPINPSLYDIDTAIRTTADNLERTAWAIGNLLALKNTTA